MVPLRLLVCAGQTTRRLQAEHGVEERESAWRSAPRGGGTAHQDILTGQCGQKAAEEFERFRLIEFRPMNMSFNLTLCRVIASSFNLK